MSNKDEQIRNLLGSIHLAGKLAELEAQEKTGSDGVKYLSIRGAVQCSEDDAAYTAFFRSYIRAQKTNGADNKLYAPAKKWVMNVTPMTKDKNNPSYVDLAGSITCNNYVSADGSFQETLTNDIKFFNKFKEFAYEMDVEGYIKSIIDEEDSDGNYTGRKKVILIGKDFYNKALVFNKDKILYAPKDIAEAFDDAGYEVGKTVTISCNRVKLETKPKVKKGGFGKQPVTGGKTKMIWEIVGGDPALDEDDNDALTPSQIKELLYVYDENNKEIIEKGYLGGKNNKGLGTHKTGLGAKTSKKVDTSDMMEDDEDDDEEIPF